MTLTIIVAIVAFLAVTLVLVGLLSLCEGEAHVVGRRDDRHQRRREGADHRERFDAARNARQQQRLSAFRLRRRRFVRHVQMPGARRRRRHPADRNGLHFAQNGQGSLASGVSGQGEGEPENPRSRSRARRQEVGVRGDLEPQHLDLYQGVRRETARGAKTSISVRAATSRSTSRSTMRSSSPTWTSTRSSAPTGTSSRCGIW